MSQTSYTRYKYIPDEINEKDFLAKFVIRNDIFEDIFEDIKNADFNVSNQHYILVGQRGQGKTSLLRRISIALKDDEKLSKFVIPIKFSEEQYQIRSLCRFFEVIAEELQENNGDIFTDILDNMESRIDDEDYELKCFEYVENMVQDKNKKLIILSDNIDELLGKLKEKEQRQLRQILITSSTIRIIGASTKMIEQHFDYAKPFYEYFKIIKLDGLDHEESIKFLRVIGNEKQNKKIEQIIKNSPQRIETLRQLTGGVPRTLVMLYDIFVQNNETAFEDLIKILDDVTPLYKDRMDNLPDILQDIVHNIAMNWDGVTTKELAKKTRLESKSVSSQLKQLEKYHIIEFETTGKNKIYKIKERFFNIWYLIRFGRKKDRNKVEWLVKFLTSWYERDELHIKAKSFISSIKEYFTNKNSKFINELSKSDNELLTNVIELQESDKIDEAIILLEKSKKSSKTILFALGILYKEQKKYEKAEEYYLKAIENGDNDALRNLGNLYKEQKKYEKAEEYYLKAIENGDNDALNSLSWFYFEQTINSDESLSLIEKSYIYQQGFYNTHTLAVVLLWKEGFSKSYEKFLEWLEYDDALESEEDVILYLNLLISKGQYYKAKEFFEIEKYQLKDRYKPIWYALMKLMEKEFPNEIKKMGSELKESVEEVLKEIERLKVKYTL